jgi:NAD(P)H-hydrate epimerase
MYLVSSHEMAEMDSRTIHEFGLPGHTLMENAARGAIDIFCRHFPDFSNKKICAVCGKGNNGGDGFVMARYLAGKCHVEVFLAAEKKALSGDAETNLLLLEKNGINVSEIISEDDIYAFEKKAEKYDIFIDALFGTGLNAPVRGLPEKIINIINNSDASVFAVDIPSGLDSSTGRPTGTVIRADVTATFGFPKIGHAVYPGAGLCGSIEIVDIGIPDCVSSSPEPLTSLVTLKKVSAFFTARNPEAHKGSNGHVLVIGGSAGKSGAPLMTAHSALKTGSGLVTLAVPSSIRSHAVSVPELMTEALSETDDGCIADISDSVFIKMSEGKKVLAIGPGMDMGAGTPDFLFRVMSLSQTPMVIDAGALNIIAEQPGFLKKITQPIVMTPHPGEMARLTGRTTSEIQENRMAIASEFAAEYGVCLVLKGAATIIAMPDGKVMINRTGNPALATAGTGDVLTGIISGLIAQGIRPYDTAYAGAYIHGKAADILLSSTGCHLLTATDIISGIPSTISFVSGYQEKPDFIRPDLGRPDFSFITSFESLF